MPLRRVVLLFAAANSKIVFPRSAPRGYNTFDTYDSQSLNTSAATALAEAMAAQLLPSGYEYFALDAGWDRTDDTQHLDAWGRPVAAPRYDLPKLASTVRGLGLKLGLWTIRGVHVDAVAKKLPVYGMEQYQPARYIKAGSGAAVAATWILRGDESRRRLSCDVDVRWTPQVHAGPARRPGLPGRRAQRELSLEGHLARRAAAWGDDTDRPRRGHERNNG